MATVQKSPTASKTVTEIKASEPEKAAVTIGNNFTSSENNLLKAYSIKEGDQSAIDSMAKTLGLSSSSKYNLRSVQLIAEQRFQSASHTLNLFSNIIDKIDQLKQRLINKFGN